MRAHTRIFYSLSRFRELIDAKIISRFMACCREWGQPVRDVTGMQSCEQLSLIDDGLPQHGVMDTRDDTSMLLPDKDRLRGRYCRP